MTERPGDISRRAGDIALAALRRLREEIELDAEEERAVGAALIRVVTAGVRLGVAEVSAQAIEQGVEVDLVLNTTSDDASPDDLR